MVKKKVITKKTKKKISKKKVEMDLKQIFENKFKSLINKKK